MTTEYFSALNHAVSENSKLQNENKKLHDEKMKIQEEVDCLLRKYNGLLTKCLELERKYEEGVSALSDRLLKAYARFCPHGISSGITFDELIDRVAIEFKILRKENTELRTEVVRLEEEMEEHQGSLNDRFLTAYHSLCSSLGLNSVSSGISFEEVVERIIVEIKSLQEYRTAQQYEIDKLRRENSETRAESKSLKDRNESLKDSVNNLEKALTDLNFRYGKAQQEASAVHHLNNRIHTQLCEINSLKRKLMAAQKLEDKCQSACVCPGMVDFLSKKCEWLEKQISYICKNGAQ